MRITQLDFDGVLALPLATGFDAGKIKQIVKNGTGDYTVILKYPYNLTMPVNPRAFIQPLTAGRVAIVTASDHDRVTIAVTDLAGVAADSALSVMILGSDNRLIYG